MAAREGSRKLQPMFSTRSRWISFGVTLVIAACSAPEPDRAPQAEVDGFERTGTVRTPVYCAPTMHVFPVRGEHNIGYDAASCGGGPCDVSCPDQNANSDWGGVHHGVDVFAHYRADLQAVTDGTIVGVGMPSGSSGLRVVLQDACGWTYYYGHMDEAVVGVGQVVQAGQLIGFMGQSGAASVHLHFNVAPDGDYYSDIDPTALLSNSSASACGGGACDGCAAFGCGCVDGQCNGGACPGTGCSFPEWAGCAVYGSNCADHHCSGGTAPGSGCTLRETLDCGAYGSACVDHQCNGGTAPGSGCTLRETRDCGAYGSGCVDHRCNGGTAPGTGCTIRQTETCKSAGKVCANGVCK